MEGGQARSQFAQRLRSCWEREECAWAWPITKPPSQEWMGPFPLFPNIPVKHQAIATFHRVQLNRERKSSSHKQNNTQLWNPGNSIALLQQRITAPRVRGQSLKDMATSGGWQLGYNLIAENSEGCPVCQEGEGCAQSEWAEGTAGDNMRLFEISPPSWGLPESACVAWRCARRGGECLASPV